MYFVKKKKHMRSLLQIEIEQEFVYIVQLASQCRMLRPTVKTIMAPFLGRRLERESGSNHYNCARPYGVFFAGKNQIGVLAARCLYRRSIGTVIVVAQHTSGRNGL